MARKRNKAEGEAADAAPQVEIDPLTGTTERIPAPERADPAAVVHGGEAGKLAHAEKVEGDRVAAIEKATSGEAAEGEATTSGEPPVVDPDRAPYKSTEALGYRARPQSAEASDPNAVPPETDKVYGIATRARWGETPTHELAAEQREIRENQRKLDEKRG